MAARRSSRTARCTPIITPCGSTRRTRTTSSTATTAASASATTRARPGKASTTWISASTTTSATTWTTPYNVCGGLQDNYTWCGPSAVRSRNGIVNDDWFRFRAATASRRQIDPTDPRIDLRRVAGRQHRRVSTACTNERKTIRPLPGPRRAAAALELEHAHPHLAARSGDDLRRRQQGVQVDRSRPDVDRRSAPISRRSHRSRRRCR